MTFDFLDYCNSEYSEEDELIDPPMNFPGNKILNMRKILPLLPYGKKFIDVFGGTGSVIINRKPSKFEIYNDRHAGFTAFYKCIQNQETLEQLKDAIELMPHTREFFQWCKDTYRTDRDVVRGAKWYYLVQTSFAGQGDSWGFNTKTPVNRAMQKLLKYIPHFDKIHERFRMVQVENLDWRELLERYDCHETVWYLDPPYWDSNPYEFKMSRQDHKDLCDKIFELEGFVAVSGYPNSLYDNYPWDGVHTWELPTKISRDIQAREIKTECLWIKEFEDDE